MEVRDPIHGFIEYSPIEKQIIDTPVFQRLRQVKQLALANYVYPGANHTRFEHSLGVMHVSGEMASHLNLTEDSKRLVRLSGLLHDIGHGPFGHVSEEVFKSLQIQLPEDISIYKIHELITVKVIESEKFMADLLQGNANEIADTLRPDGTPSIERDIVSSPFDADKIDYLLRDSYFCGVKYGVFDHRRLIMELSKYDFGRTTGIVVKEEGIQCFEQYVLAKYFIATQVYRHRIRLITDAMLIRAIILSYETNSYINDLYSLDLYSEDYLNFYLKSRDIDVLDQGVNGKSKGAMIFDCLIRRDLFKMVFKCSGDDIDDGPASVELLNQSKHTDKKKIARFEELVSKLFNVDPELTILRIYGLNTMAGETGQPGEVYVKTIDRPKQIQGYSKICREVGTGPGDIFIEIYIYLQMSDEEREKICNANRDKILEYLNDFDNI